MKLLPKKLRESRYIRHVALLMSGTAAAQLIPVAASPLLTRLYSPADFGILAIFMGVIGVLGVFITGRYEQAVVLPSSPVAAYNLVALCILITSVAAGTSVLIVVTLAQGWIPWLDLRQHSGWLYFVPPTVFLAGLDRALTFWFTRMECYRQLATAKLIQGLMVASVSAVLGFIGWIAEGLVIGWFAGFLGGVSFLVATTLRQDREHLAAVKGATMRQLAIRYKDFPQFTIASSFLRSSGVQVPVLVLSGLFGTASVGLYSLAHRVLRLPLTAFVRSLSYVFRQRAAKRLMQGQGAFPLFRRTLLTLVAIGVLPFTLLAILGPDLFEIVLGDQWRGAGHLAQVMTAMFFAQFVVNPVSPMLLVAERNRMDLVVHGLGLLLVVAAILAGWLFKDFFFTIVLLSAANVGKYSILLALCWITARQV